MSKELLGFLARAKKATYASGISPVSGVRPSSHDLTYSEGDFLYMDTYLGGMQFIGEETAWLKGEIVWGMNYYGRLFTKNIPEGFSPFLKAALLEVDNTLPARGPQKFVHNGFIYQCFSSGTWDCFEGYEDIYIDHNHIYHLVFHGGSLRD